MIWLYSIKKGAVASAEWCNREHGLPCPCQCKEVQGGVRTREQWTKEEREEEEERRRKEEEEDDDDIF